MGESKLKIHQGLQNVSDAVLGTSHKISTVPGIRVGENWKKKKRTATRRTRMQGCQRFCPERNHIYLHINTFLSVKISPS